LQNYSFHQDRYTKPSHNENKQKCFVILAYIAIYSMFYNPLKFYVSDISFLLQVKFRDNSSFSICHS